MPPPPTSAARRDHDQRFKRLFEARLQDLLKIVEPALADKLDFTRAKPLRGEFFSSLPHGRRRAVDLLVELPLRANGGETRLVLIHIEIQAKSREAMKRRMAEYDMLIRLHHDKDVLPILVNLTGGPKGVTRQEYIESVGGRETLRFTYTCLGLSGSLATELLGRDEPLAWALSALTKSELPPEQHAATCLNRLAAASLPAAHREMLANCVKTYLRLPEDKQSKEYQLMVANPSKRVQHALTKPTWQTEIEERAREEGRAQGRAEALNAVTKPTWQAELEERARAEALRAMLLRQLAQRFGPLPAGVTAKVEAISSTAELIRLGEQLLAAESLSELGLADD